MSNFHLQRLAGWQTAKCNSYSPSGEINLPCWYLISLTASVVSLNIRTESFSEQLRDGIFSAFDKQSTLSN